jgi:hypothetical protein
MPTIEAIKRRTFGFEQGQKHALLGLQMQHLHSILDQFNQKEGSRLKYSIVILDERSLNRNNKKIPSLMTSLCSVGTEEFWSSPPFPV